MKKQLLLILSLFAVITTGLHFGFKGYAAPQIEEGNDATRATAFVLTKHTWTVTEVLPIKTLYRLIDEDGKEFDACIPLEQEELSMGLRYKFVLIERGYGQPNYFVANRIN